MKSRRLRRVGHVARSSVRKPLHNNECHNSWEESLKANNQMSRLNKVGTELHAENWESNSPS